MRGLDFKDWEKVACDLKSTTLRHSKGHTMTIAHSGLPRIQQEQLKRLKMAEGGEVSHDSVPEPNKKNAEAMQKGATESGWQPAQWGKNLKEGLGMASNEAQGGKIQGRKYFDEGTPSESVSPPDEKDDSKDQAAPDSSPQPVAPTNPTNITINAAPAAPAQNPAMMAPIPHQVSPAASAPRYESPGPAPQVPIVPVVPSSNPRQAIANEAAQGVAQQQLVDQAKGEELAKIQDRNLKQQQAEVDRVNQARDMMHAVTERHDAYTQANPIDNKHIFKDMSVPGKVSTALGLLIGGFAPGGVNPAMNWLMDQQAKDIDAQKARQGQQNTVFQNYQNLFGDDVIAHNLATVSYNNMLKTGADQIAARQATPQAAATAALVKSDLDRKNFDSLGVAGQRWSGIRSGQIKPVSSSSSKISTGNMASAKSGKEQPKNDTPYNYKPALILQPGSTEKFNGIKYDPTIPAEQKTMINAEFSRASQADKALQQLPDIMNSLYENATPSGAFARKLTPEMAGAVGEVLGPVIGAGTGLLSTAGALASDKLYGTNQYQTNTDYNGSKAVLTDLLTNALRGNPNVTPHQIREWANDFAPEIGDDEKRRLNKLKNMERIIKTNANVSTMETKGWAKTK